MSSENGDEIVTIKTRILELFTELDEGELNCIEKWISRQSYKDDLAKKKRLLKSEKQLLKIGEALKKLVPLEAEMSSEKIVFPIVGTNADCNSMNMLHVDEFLYDQDQVDQLVKEGIVKRHYCVDCNSRNIQDLIYISHSMSKQALQYIFKVLLPTDLIGKHILDIGSRFGTVLYAAYHLSNASTIVGIEMNKECCEVQKKIIHKFNMDAKRIRTVCADVMERSDIIVQSDIIVMNVLDFFVNKEKHIEMWYFFKKYMKKGTYLILNRSIVDTLSGLNIFEEFMDWLTICKPNQMDNEIFFNIEDCSELYLYSVN